MYFHCAAWASSKINKAKFSKQALKPRRSDGNEQEAEWKVEGSTILKKILTPGITTFYWFTQSSLLK